MKEEWIWGRREVCGGEWGVGEVYGRETDCLDIMFETRIYF